MREDFYFEAALAALQDGQGLTGKTRLIEGGMPTEATVASVIPPIRFNPLPWAHRDQRRRYHIAGEPEGCDLTM